MSLPYPLFHYRQTAPFVDIVMVSHHPPPPLGRSQPTIPQSQVLLPPGEANDNNSLPVHNATDARQVLSKEAREDPMPHVVPATTEIPVEPDASSIIKEHRYSLGYLMREMRIAKGFFKDTSTSFVPVGSTAGCISIGNSLTPGATTTDRRRHSVDCLSEKQRLTLPSIAEINESLDVGPNLQRTSLSIGSGVRGDGDGEKGGFTGLKEGGVIPGDGTCTSTRTKGSGVNRNRTNREVEMDSTSSGIKKSTTIMDVKDSATARASRKSGTSAKVKQHKASPAAGPEVDKPSCDVGARSKHSMPTTSERVLNWNIEELVAEGLSLWAADGPRELVQNLLDRGIQDHRAAFPTAKITREIQMELYESGVEGKRFGQIMGAEASRAFKEHWKQVLFYFLIYFCIELTRNVGRSVAISLGKSARARASDLGSY